MVNIQNIQKDLEQLLFSVGNIVEQGYKDKNKEVSTKKDDNNFVTLLTKYDISVNKKIIEYLELQYPEFSIISEEAPEINKPSDYSFVVDPIDGTRNFVRSIPLFFIGIGFVKKNQTILSVTHNPITKDMFWAIKGKGAYLNGNKIEVSDRILKESDVIVRTLPNKKLEKEVVTNIIENVHQVKNNMCSHDEISGVACNRYDAIVSKGSSPWDYCHYLLVEEAGGKATDWNGAAFDISKDNIILSNGIIHDELLKMVKK
ncbi:hypothetical protein COB57_01725 [Candidatus Peregrinibacteria bacterium]|nr:MAG: hypothetical protein COB57_01725 [Candidatus Peregrinibacteria bacterium]